MTTLHRAVMGLKTVGPMTAASAHGIDAPSDLTHSSRITEHGASRAWNGSPDNPAQRVPSVR